MHLFKPKYSISLMQNPDEFPNERMKVVFPYIKDKEVLDIGCYAELRGLIHNIKNDKSWVHGFLSRNSKHTVGIDIVPDKIETIRKAGYDVYCMSAENFSFKKKFDVIFAGDVIEHLDNPGLMLKQCRKHLKEDGLLIITTYNVFSIDYKIAGLVRFLNNDLEVHPNHTCFFSPATIKSLLFRNGFKAEKIILVNPPVDPKWDLAHRIKANLKNSFCHLFPSLKYEMVIFASISEFPKTLEDIGIPVDESVKMGGKPIKKK
jgi:2-polyprenyl-3-methyl-5-hydroxy-6-metoxy-1,4-benzoquinol methylase